MAVSALGRRRRSGVSAVGLLRRRSDGVRRMTPLILGPPRSTLERCLSRGDLSRADGDLTRLSRAAGLSRAADLPRADGDLARLCAAGLSRAGG